MKHRLEIHPQLVCELLTRFIMEETEKVGVQKVVFGLSGGIDSALVAFLAVRALGTERVHAVMMPYKTSSPASLEDAQACVHALGIEASVVDITPQIDAYFERFPDATPLRRGNKMARERMSILYDFSARLNAMVLGTSNKTELLLGYGTQHGDLASGINPIGDLYKTQVRQLARYLGVPSTIITKPPSADLWEDQTDEKELGFTYEEVDKLLFLLVDRRYTKEELLAEGFDEEFIDTVIKRIARNQYKRRIPLIAKISNRTIGIDFRYPRDWGV
jgi:NAD+ synthase